MIKESSRVIKGEAVTIKMPKLEDWPITQLRKTCKKNKVKGYTKMTKEQLVEAVRQILDDFHSKKEEGK